MNMKLNKTNQTNRTGENDDQLGANMDSEMEHGHTEGNNEEQDVETTTKELEKENAGVNDGDPFKPRKSISRSPAGERNKKMVDTDNAGTSLKQNKDQESIIGDDEDEIFLQLMTEDPATKKNINGNRVTGDSKIIYENQIAKMIKYISEARKATKAIYEYATTTKNIKGLLKEKSKWALIQLENLNKEIEITNRNKVEQTPTQVNNAREVTKTQGIKKDIATQTTREDRPNIGHKPRMNENVTESRAAKRKVVSPLQNAGKMYKRTGKHEEGKETNTSDKVTSNQGIVENAVESADKTSTTRREPMANEESWELISRKKTTVQKQNEGNGQQGQRPKERVGKPINPINSRQRGEALSIAMGGNLTFAEIVGKLKENTGPEAHGIRGLRRTQNGNLLVEFNKGRDSTELYNKLISKMDESCTIRRMIPKMDIEILDIDPTVETEELKETIQKNINVGRQDIRIKIFKTTKVGLKRAIVEIPTKGMINLEGKTKLKIGWTMCRVKVITKVTRCFKCHDIGHRAISCHIIGDEHLVCRKCGEPGHTITECKGTPRCILCIKRGYKGDIGHVAGSFRCPVYGEAVRMKETRSKTSNG